MSNSLQDAIAEVVLRAIIRFPYKCPPALLKRASNHISVWDFCMKENHEEQIRRGRFSSDTWNSFKESLEQHSDALPAILADYEP